MSAADEDTELRDLLIHTLENNGVLSKMKAELRASVFLALEEQERAESKPRLVNESLRQFLGSREGRLVAGLVTDFLQHFHLDFTLAVLQPEASLPSTPPEERLHVAAELGLPEAGKGGPLLLDVIRQLQPRQPPGIGLEAPSPAVMAEARARYERCARDGEVSLEEVTGLLADLFPHLPRDMLDTFVREELTATADRDPSAGVDVVHFLAMYRLLYPQRMPLHPSANLQALTRLDSPSPTKIHDPHLASHPPIPQSHPPKPQSHLQPAHDQGDDSRLDNDDLEGDSFFDDPIPKQEKAYDWKEEASKPNGSLLNSRADKSEPNSHSEAANLNDGSQHSSTKDLKVASERMASLELGAGNEDDYADDFTSTSQRSDKSEVSIGEDLEEELSVDDLTGSDHKLEDFTLDNSISHISDVADYLEDVS